MRFRRTKAFVLISTFWVLVIMLAACTVRVKSSEDKRDELTKEHIMVCTHDVAADAPITVYRCESDEVICYTRDGISCKWKNKDNK
jgi:hypothetical protein